MTITKPQNDTREYKSIKLDNQLSVLLISDSKAEKAAAALDCHVGSLSDPAELQGLAHFCEHLLFMGTKTYPDEAEYTKFLSKHGGSSNAFTTGDRTNYYFDVQADHFEPALDRFSKFFIEPLFLESCIDRELKAVDSEHKKNLQNDTWSSYQLLKDSADPNHPFSNFGTGNLTTLKHEPESKGIDIKKRLLQFYDTFYSANIMNLVLTGKESLEVLENWAREKFSAITNKNIEIPSFGLPFTSSYLSKIIKIKPTKEIRQLTIFFQVKDHTKDYKTSPLSYFSHFIGHEGPSSLLAYLKSKLWANELYAGSSGYGSKGFNFFKVQIVLTKEGLLNYEEIMVNVFEYIQMLKDHGPIQWAFEECQKLSNISFRFKEKSSPSSYCSSLAGDMHKYEPDDYLEGPYKMIDYKPELIQSCFSYFSPENIVVLLQAPPVGPIDDWKKSKWYGMSYKDDRIEESQIARMKFAAANSNFAIPARNSFIPERFDVDQIKAPKPFPHPWIISESPSLRLWFKKDDTFLVPKGSLQFEINSNYGYDTVSNHMMAKLYASLLKDALNEFSYFAELAGLEYDLSSATNGLTLTVNGYNDKFGVLLEKILDKMLALPVDPANFARIKDSIERENTNWFQGSPYLHASRFVSMLTQEKLFTTEAKLEALKSITLEHVLEFYPKLLKTSFSEGLVVGNFTKAEAFALGQILETKLRSTPLPEKLYLMQTYVFPKGSVIYSQACYNADNPNSGIEYYLQFGSIADPLIRCKSTLLAQIAKEPVFSVLRTTEQLGYIVHSGLRKQTGMTGLKIMIQSEHEPLYLEYRIESFLEQFLEILDSMEPVEFEKHCLAVSNALLEEPKNLKQEARTLNSVISSHQCNFDDFAKDAAMILTITKSEIVKFFKKYCLPGPDRVKLSAFVKSAKCSHQYSTEALQAMEQIQSGSVLLKSPEEISAFQKNLGLGGIPAPVRPIEEFYKF